MGDINFDDYGKVTGSRFRFSHTPVQYQNDFIRDLVETRKVSDLFAQQLVPLNNQAV